jgi:hypothetical protein
MALTHNANTFVGRAAGGGSTTGTGNTFIGYSAGDMNTTGSNNTIIGVNADVSSVNLSNSTAIGNGAVVNASNKIRLGNAAVTVVEGPVAYTVSDQRFKTNVREEVSGLGFIMKLRPVTYQLKAKELDVFLSGGDPTQKNMIGERDYTIATTLQHSGFIPQEVESAANAVGYVFNGIKKPANGNDTYSLAYSQFVVPLVKAV